MTKVYAWVDIDSQLRSKQTSLRDIPLYTKPQGDCGETCKRAKLCYACSRELGGLNPGDILRCVETDELCTVMYTGTSGKTLVKWADNNFGTYTADQIGELFWVEPKPQWQGLTFDDMDWISKDWIAGARWAEAKLKEKNGG
jgi:hypothetical protein